MGRLAAKATALVATAGAGAMGAARVGRAGQGAGLAGSRRDWSPQWPGVLVPGPLEGCAGGSPGPDPARGCVRGKSGRK